MMMICLSDVTYLGPAKTVPVLLQLFAVYVLVVSSHTVLQCSRLDWDRYSVSTAQQMQIYHAFCATALTFIFLLGFLMHKMLAHNSNIY